MCFLFPLWERLFADPFAPPAFTGFFTTMSQSDFWQAFGFSPFTRLQFPLPCFRSLPDLPSIQILLCALATLSDPDGTYGTLAYRLPYCCLRPKEKYRLPLYITTLSHCGSRTPLPTLKPHLTASAPRLCTDCLLSFIGFGLSPNYIICTVSAHVE